jgi:uncharacterized protein (DUF488 family)
MSTLLTIGHSTRPSEELIDFLVSRAIAALVDVRRFPSSRRHPQFAKDALASALEASNIEYVHEVDLGGRRSTRRDSPNTAWRVAAFRGYADYMATPSFQQALSRIEQRAQRQTVALMCAEAVPWRCHRRLIADALVARGHSVRHILGPGCDQDHELSELAHVRTDRSVYYPASEDRQRKLPGV